MEKPLLLRPFGGPINASVVLPGSKSITNRALLAAGLASGTSTLLGALRSDDTQAMIDCVRALGAEVHEEEEGRTLRVRGVAGDIANAQETLFARQSGTTARFVAAALALGDSSRLLDADPAMRVRPMESSFESLRQLGVTVTCTKDEGYLPVSVRGPVKNSGSRAVLEVDGSVSSQFASGLMLAAPYFPNGLELQVKGEVVSRPYLDMTASVMEAFGASVEVLEHHSFIISPGAYIARTYDIEPDASAASYFFAAAAICGGTVRIDGLGSSSMQGDVSFVDVLREMGAEVRVERNSITVTGRSLQGVNVDFSQISDTAQTIAAVAVFADGPTTISGVGFIRRKETNRIHAIVTELRRLGIEAHEDADGFTIFPGETVPAVVETYDDHRMAMSMALIGLVRPGVQIQNPGCVQKTFPEYFHQIENLRPGGSQ